MTGRATPEMNERVGEILDNIERGRNVMPKGPTVECPTCNGAKVASGRYTDAAPVACPTCDGSGVVPADDEVANEVEAQSVVPKPKTGSDG